MSHSQELVNANKQLQAIRERDGVVTSPSATTVDLDWLEALKATMPVQTIPEVQESAPTSNANTLLHHGEIALAALGQGQSAHYQLWLVLRWLDESGSGCRDWKEIRQKVTNLASPHFLYKKARFDQVLREGNGRYWLYDGRRIWIQGTPRVAAALQVGRVAGDFVHIKEKQIFTSIGEFRAWCYAAWLVNHPRPLSRQTIKRLTGIDGRTQQRYSNITGIGATQNIATGSRVSEADIQEMCWRQEGVFVLVDYKGLQGPEKCAYYGWHLPNCYEVPVEVSGTRRSRRHNRTLWKIPPAGNAECQRKVRLFHDDGKSAAKAFNRHQEQVYWQWAESRAGRGLWFSVGL